MTDSRFDDYSNYSGKNTGQIATGRLAGGTAIWALLLLYYGFFSGSWISSVATIILEYTTKIGGIAMVISALLLLSGRPVALLIDGITSMAVGVGLAVGGLAWVIQIKGLDLTCILQLICGYLLFTHGRDSYTAYKPAVSIPNTGNNTPIADNDEPHSAERLIEPIPTTSTTHSAPQKNETVEEPEIAKIEPPEGYLASFARPKEDKRNYE